MVLTCIGKREGVISRKLCCNYATNEFKRGSTVKHIHWVRYAYGVWWGMGWSIGERMWVVFVLAERACVPQNREWEATKTNWPHKHWNHEYPMLGFDAPKKVPGPKINV